jgi:hypothetical protein
MINLPSGVKSAPQRLFLVAARIGALQPADEGIALLFGYNQRREAAAPPFNLGDSIPLAGPGADQGHRTRAEYRRRSENGECRCIEKSPHVEPPCLPTLSKSRTADASTISPDVAAVAKGGAMERSDVAHLRSTAAAQ